MRKSLLFGCLVVSIFSLSLREVSAALVEIGQTGGVTVNVLAETDPVALEIPKSDYLVIRDVAQETVDSDTKVELKKEGSEVTLVINTKEGERSLNVTGFGDNLVEIEERAPIQKLFLRVKEGKFEIYQGGFVAVTDYEIEIDPKTSAFTLKTPSGFRFLSVLPKAAAEAMLRTKLITRISAEEELKIIELPERELAYEIKGDKVINVFNVFDYSIPVVAKVSASTGEMLSIDEPSWLRFLGFLFA